MDMQEVSEALAAAAGTVISTPKLITYAFVPHSVTAPCCFVAEYTIDFDRAMNRALDAVDVTMRALVSPADEAVGTRRLNGLLSGSGGGALKQAIESARGAPGELALGGAADDYRVTRIEGGRWYQHDGVQYLGAEITVHVIGSSA